MLWLLLALEWEWLRTAFFLFLFFKVELRGETTCVLQKGVLRWLVREGDPLLAPHGHGFQVQI